MTTGFGLAAVQDATTNPTSSATQAAAIIAKTLAFLLFRMAFAMLAILFFIDCYLLNGFVPIGTSSR
jgi:hypothetical protein